ncbi:MAG TPA: tripartite tricarboxylate transporter substrate-binding protein, partial [Burkholderiaceae bacterium]|nr:tripartite tricarboxylate transporter substrate-binding protein [Burkholderiaceae bacterium]
VKTTAELGFPYLQMSIWHSLYAPAGTPPEITRKIAADVDRILAEPEVRKQIAGFRVLGGTPQALAARLREEVARAAEMIANAGIQPE